MNDIRRAIAFAAPRFHLSHEAAELLPGQVLAETYEARERNRQTVESAQEDHDGTNDQHPTD